MRRLRNARQAREPSEVGEMKNMPGLLQKLLSTRLAGITGLQQAGPVERSFLWATGSFRNFGRLTSLAPPAAKLWFSGT
jgi:hypothetical protein